MKTKNLLWIASLATLLSTTVAFAQNTNSNARPSKEDVNQRIDKCCNRMRDQLQIDDATAAKFMPLYKEYLNELRTCKPATCQSHSQQCTDADKKACIENRMNCREKMIQTQKKYYSKFEKFLNADQLQRIFCPAHHRGHHFDKSNKRYNKHCYDRGQRNNRNSGSRTCNSGHNCR